MLTREEIDFHRKIISELCGIRKALEKIAGAVREKTNSPNNDNGEENDHREA
ncbi:MAG: hypothetical protein J5747_01530 [Spirochaetaceae bacterium]|nr:hypothetical protein [Spirochaetaceae bacterium]MCR4715183.1 hypothetical protein [Treponemataceae bacterium]